VLRRWRGQQGEQRTCQVVTELDPDLGEGCRLRKKRSAWQNGEKDDSGEGEAHACYQIMATFLLGVRRCILKSGAKWHHLACPAS